MGSDTGRAYPPREAPSGTLGRAVHEPALDGLRALAATLVVLTHAAFLTGFVTNGGLFGRLFGRGDLGVAIFFALSGYLLHRSLVLEDEAGGARFGRYAVRRFVRIAPAYWVCLGVVALTVHPSARDVAADALAVQIYLPDASIPAFSQSWSIATEVSFYAVLPLVVVGMRRLRARGSEAPMRVLLLLLVLGVGTAWLASSGRIGVDTLYERWLPARTSNFALGIVLAEATLLPRSRITRWLVALAHHPGTCVAAAAAAYLLATTPIAGALTLGVVSGLQLAVKMALSTVVAGGLMIPLVFGGRSGLGQLLSHPTTRWLGLVSFGVFLWHLPVFKGLYAVGGLREFTGGLVPLLALGVPITLLVSAMSYYLIEQPCSRWVSARLRRREAAGAALPEPGSVAP